MNERFGPWSSALGNGHTPHLSTFWKRRLMLLASARSARLGVTRRDWLKLGAAGAAAWALPTIHQASADGPNNLKPVPVGKIYVPGSLKTGMGKNDWLQGVFAIDPETAKYTKVCDFYWYVRVSRDGRTLLLSEGGKEKDRSVSTLATDGKSEKRRIAGLGGETCWSPDGKQIIVATNRSGPEAHRLRCENWRFNADGSGGGSKLPIPETDQVCDWSPDGQWLVTTSDRRPPFGRGYQLFIMRPDGSDQRRLTEGDGLNVYARFSPDGRRIAYWHADSKFKTVSLWVVNLDGSDRRRLLEELLEIRAVPEGCCWSADGASVAYVSTGLPDHPEETYIGPLEYANPRIVIIDAEGKSRRTLKLPPAWSLGAADWH